ncbi:unnamed protein product [Heligmosomoides polygyrus]|uniref:Notch n=1 Tax=Heligmosomoides polygyrus TaxID=6339 RepID=A0A3P8FLF9_HELPZ|nr:unnamed protein product [Heligmosomoides polygyrus]
MRSLPSHTRRLLVLLLCISWTGAPRGDARSRCPADFQCQNGGSCGPDGNCVCTSGWAGKTCEMEAIPCPDQPCVYGVCVAEGDGQQACRCDHRFEGRLCERDKDECALKVCPPDAICMNLVPKRDTDKGYSCVCPEGYTGEFCDLEVDLCKLYMQKGENYCHNGGVCGARHVCMCQNGFGGPRCGHRVPLLEEYEEFGCPERPEVCAKLFDDGHCDEICNREQCLFDGFDCAKRDGTVCRSPAECAYKYGDGKCDKECEGPECGYDGGDCEKNATSYSSEANMIGVVVGVPPDVAVGNLRQLEAQLAQVSTISTDVNGTMVFFDVDTSGCRVRRRKGLSQRCFTDLRAAATYLTLELARKRPLDGETLPIRDISWRKKQLESIQTLSPPVVLVLVCAVVLTLLVAFCGGVIVAIVKARRRRQTTVFAPCWKVPNSGNCYHPPTPPYSGSPEHAHNSERGSNAEQTNDRTSKAVVNSLLPIVDSKSPLLIAVRRGDHEKVREMIASKETFVDALFERSTAGQSPLLFAARIAHPGLECVSLLVEAIDVIRKRRHDDLLSVHFEDLQRDRKDLLRMLPLRDEADAKYALTDSMGRNVLHYAALCNAAHLVNYFAACGANVNLIDYNVMFILHAMADVDVTDVNKVVSSAAFLPEAPLEFSTCRLQIDPWLSSQKFFHGFLSREDLPALLQNDGDFLVRCNEADKGQPREIIVSVLYDPEGKSKGADQNGKLELVRFYNSGTLNVWDD